MSGSKGEAVSDRAFSYSVSAAGALKPFLCLSFVPLLV